MLCPLKYANSKCSIKRLAEAKGKQVAHSTKNSVKMTRAYTCRPIASGLVARKLAYSNTADRYNHRLQDGRLAVLTNEHVGDISTLPHAA